MLSRLRPLSLGLLAASALLLTSPAASAQVLHDVWFKVKASASGYSVHTDTGAVTKAKASRTAFLHFTNAVTVAPGDGGAPTHTYKIDVWTETSPGQFELTYTTNEAMLGVPEQLMVDIFLEFALGTGGGSNFFGGYSVLKFAIKLDGDDNFQKASFKSLGGETVAGTLDGGVTDFVGSLKITGTSIDESKLPFAPV